MTESEFISYLGFTPVSKPTVTIIADSEFQILATRPNILKFPCEWHSAEPYDFTDFVILKSDNSIYYVTTPQCDKLNWKWDRLNYLSVPDVDLLLPRFEQYDKLVEQLGNPETEINGLIEI